MTLFCRTIGQLSRYTQDGHCVMAPGLVCVAQNRAYKDYDPSFHCGVGKSIIAQQLAAHSVQLAASGIHMSSQSWCLLVSV